MDGVFQIKVVKSGDTPVLNTGEIFTDNQRHILYVGAGDKLLKTKETKGHEINSNSKLS